MHPFLKLDEDLLLAINGAHCEFFDHLMLAVTHRFFWIPFYVFLAYMLVRKEGWKAGLFCLVVIGLMITFADQTCSSVIRPMVERYRPSSPLNPISQFIHIVDGHRGGTFGFPSAHAANTLALALFLSFVFRNRIATLGLIAWAILVSYSRVYLGLHYPGDIIAGFLIGGAYSLLFYQAYNFSRLYTTRRTAFN